MGRRRKIDPEKLRKRVQQGKVPKGILEKFGFRDSSGIEVAPEIRQTTEHKSTIKIDKLIKVNKWGSISIPKDVAEMLGMEEGDSFLACKVRAGILLKRV